MKLCHFEAGLDQPLFLIAGPCVIESEQLAHGHRRSAEGDHCASLGIPFIYKSSFDKANRSLGQVVPRTWAWTRACTSWRK